MEARELPRGTVTLLFTDIEGSTRMLQELGREAYVRALTEHRRLLREAFTAHGGLEVEMQGDSFHFAFSSARDAVAAAVAGQRALQEHEWASEPIRVRIGLHTGEPMQADGLYAGLDVHRAARVMSAGHGGQVVVSARTADLVTGELSDGISLVDLGEHRLKDLTAPQRLYQASGRGLPGEFPQLKTLAPARTNLPLAASLLIGREGELRDLIRLLTGGSRVVTITGAGGSGKTRLALQVAAELVERFPDGVFWVPLASLTDPGLVLPTIAQALSAKSDLASYLSERTSLLLLDNFEHLLEASAALSQLLAAAPRARVLVTSRAPLRIDGEREYALDPLGEAAAVMLFLERSGAVGREVDTDAPVAEICRRLDNLPLAIELAAARTKLFTPQALLARLEHRLPLLTEGRRDAPERQQTLRATIDWSYELLDDAAKRVFGRLSIFAGSFSFEAAELVAGADLGAVGALANLSLLKPVGDDRLLMLETIREFARSKLADGSDAARVRRRHTEWFLARALEAEKAARGSGEAEWLEQLENDHANLRAALQAAIEDGDAQLMLRLASSLQRYWIIRSSAEEGLSWLERALVATPATATAERCLALEAAEDLARAVQDFSRSGVFARERLEYSRALNDLSGTASALVSIAVEAQFDGELVRARRLLQEALSAAQQAEDRLTVDYVLGELGFLAYAEGNLEQAYAHFVGRADSARELGDDQAIAASAGNTAAVLIEMSRYPGAAALLAEALERSQRLGWGNGIATTLEIAGVLVARALDAASAAALFGAAAALREELGTPADFSFSELCMGARESTRNLLGESRFNEAWERGRLLSTDEAVCEVERLFLTL